MKRTNVNILEAREILWKNAGILKINNWKFNYSGKQRHKKDVEMLLDENVSLDVKRSLAESRMLDKINIRPFSATIIQTYASTSESNEEDNDHFYEDLDNAVKQYRSNEVLFVMRRSECKGGFHHKRKHHSLGVTNERGERWIEWYIANNQAILNIQFIEHPTRKYMQRNLDDKARNQIDHTTISNRPHNAVQRAKIYLGADCRSDHISVVFSIQIKFRKPKRPRFTRKFHFTVLKTSSIEQRFITQV